MSKSRLNVANPDELVAEYGADALRLYEMFMGPLNATRPWGTTGMTGVRRFLDRAWRIVCGQDDALHPSVKNEATSPDLQRLCHSMIAAVTADIEAMRFNTAIARLMTFSKALTSEPVRPLEVVETFVLLLAPFAPHIAEELWGKLGRRDTLAFARWPDFDSESARDETREYIVQVNGRVRHRFHGAPNLGRSLLDVVRAQPQVIEALKGHTIIKEVVVPDRLVNFVVRK
jgi:leucyl-tRNA synthetase